MSTTMSLPRSDPVPIPANNSRTNEDTPPFSYKMLKQLAAQGPQPYGAIPPLPKKKRTKKKDPKSNEQPPRRMSHVENWVAVDSKESLPDEEDLEPSSLASFLSADFVTQVLPLHMPPPSMSDPNEWQYYRELEELARRGGKRTMSETSPPDDDLPVSDDHLEDDEDDDEDDDDEDDDGSSGRPSDDGEDGSEHRWHRLVGKRSIPSLYKAETPSTLTTTSYAVSSSPPQHCTKQFLQTITQQLKRSLASTAGQAGAPGVASGERPKTREGLSLPRRMANRKRRSEATTQPRFNPETNTYNRDTRSNPDHFRMIAAELNMMRARKLLSPLKPRGFLPRRKDVFIRGQCRRPSPLCVKPSL